MRTVPKRMLPIGIQTFRDLRERGCYYVDKTNYLASLVAQGKHYFLSRPRRFGKSLLVDTLKELFEGNEPLFRGTAIHDEWDWSVGRPVVRLDFSNGHFSVQGNLESNVMEQLAASERRASVATEYETAPGRLASLLETLAEERTSLHDLLQADDFEGLEAQLRAIFAAIPHQWHTRNEIANYQGYYASVVYSCFAAEGFDIVSEESSSRGRADMTIRYNGSIYVFEFKVVDRDAEHAAIAQLRERGYADKYQHLGVPIHLIGIEFSRAERNLAAFEVEAA